MLFISLVSGYVVMDVCVLRLRTDMGGSAIFLSLGCMQPQDDIECWRITGENDVEYVLR